MIVCCNESHKVSDHERGRGVRSWGHCRVWTFPSSFTGSRRKTTAVGLVKAHHTDFLSETQLTPQDSWFSMKAFLYMLSRGQDHGFWKRLDSKLGLDGDSQIWGREGERGSIVQSSSPPSLIHGCTLFFLPHQPRTVLITRHLATSS